MARKRGGLAGLYDRNKGLIQGAAPVVAGMFGGPAAGALVGAAIKGLDREGKSGIGLDLGQAALGGATGYAAGGMGKSLAGGLKGRLAGLFSGGGATGGLPAPNMQVGLTPGMASKGFSVAPAAMGQSAASAAPASFSVAAPNAANLSGMVAKSPINERVAQQIASLPKQTAGGSRLGRLAAFAEKNPNLVGQAAKMAMSATGPDNEGRAMDLRERQYEDEQEAMGRRASIVSQLLSGMPGGMPSRQMGSMNDYMAGTTGYPMNYERMPDGPYAQSRNPTFNDYIRNRTGR